MRWRIWRRLWWTVTSVFWDRGILLLGEMYFLLVEILLRRNDFQKYYNFLCVMLWGQQRYYNRTRNSFQKAINEKCREEMESLDSVIISVNCKIKKMKGNKDCGWLWQNNINCIVMVLKVIVIMKGNSYKIPAWIVGSSVNSALSYNIFNLY